MEKALHAVAPGPAAPRDVWSGIPVAVRTLGVPPYRVRWGPELGTKRLVAPSTWQKHQATHPASLVFSRPLHTGMELAAAAPFTHGKPHLCYAQSSWANGLALFVPLVSPMVPAASCFVVRLRTDYIDTF